jgi:hypothetical protein
LPRLRFALNQLISILLALLVGGLLAQRRETLE